MDCAANDIPRVNIDHQVAIEVLALDRASQLGDVPAEHLAGPRGNKFQDCAGRVTGLSTTVFDLLILLQHPVNR